MQPRPRVYVIAGPNGAGKTTFALRFLPHYAHCPNFLNADLIAVGLAPLAPGRAAVAAGRLVLTELAALARQGSTFAFESTLAGHGYVPLLRRWRGWGYGVTLFYLWLPSPQVATRRIQARVRNGGHNVPPADARRRYFRSVRNFFALYRTLADEWMIFDNSARQPRLIAKCERAQTHILDEVAFKRMERTGR